MRAALPQTGMHLSWRSLVVAAWLACSVAAAQQRNPEKLDRRSSPQPLAAEESPAAAGLHETELQLRDQLQRDPQAPELLYRLALVLRQENQPKESLAFYSQAAALRRPSAAELRSVALDYVLLNDYEDAIHWLRVALSLDANNADVLYSLGRCLYTENHFDEAEEAFRRVLVLRPGDIKAEENLGLTLDARNQPKMAEEALRQAVTWATERGITDPWPYLDLGDFLLDQQRAAEALPSLTKAVTLGPQLGRAHEKLGRALVDTGDAKAGAAELEQAAKLDPGNPKVHFELGQAYRNAGEQEKARAEFALSRSLYGQHNQY